MTNQTNSNLSMFKNLVNFFINKDGSVSMSRILVSFLILMCVALYVDRDIATDIIKSFNYGRSYEAYIEAERKIQQEDYEASMRVQTQSVYSVVEPDMVAVYMYEPEDLHHFKRLVHFEGKMPNSGMENKMELIGVDKSDKEYKDHILGIPYWGKMDEYKSVESKNIESFKYTCPIFNRKGVYSGVFGMYWNEQPADINEPHKMQQLYVSCTQGAREIGIHKT